MAYHNLILYHGGLAVLLAGCLMFAWGLRSLGFTRLLEATYFETYRLINWYDPRFFVTSLTVVPIGLYLAAAAAPQRCVRWVLCLATAWSGVIFFLGFRGFALIPALTVLAVLNKRGFRPSKRVYVLGLAAVLVAIPAVTVIRSSPLSERSISEVFSSVRTSLRSGFAPPTRAATAPRRTQRDGSEPAALGPHLALLWKRNPIAGARPIGAD